MFGRHLQKTAAQSGEQVEDNGVFSTAVNEKTILDAKSRQNDSIFQTEKWGMEKPPQPSMKQIMDETAVQR